MPSLPETGPHMRDLTIDHPDHPMAADRGMFRITRMDKVFPVFADCAAASAALGGRS